MSENVNDRANVGMSDHMSDRKEMISFALARMAGFTIEHSSDGDNRSIFGLIKALLQSASGDTLADCRKPLSAVLSIRDRDQKERFQGLKLALLHQTIIALFGDLKNLLSDIIFAGYTRDKLLEYLEICRRAFIAKYVPVIANVNDKNSNSGNSKTTEPVYETEIQRAWRQEVERSERGVS